MWKDTWMPESELTKMRKSLKAFLITIAVRLCGASFETMYARYKAA